MTIDDLNQKILSIRIDNHPAACGRGNVNPLIVFVGEALGEQEEIQRKPFVGPAGQALDSMLLDSGLSTVPHYITNVVKVRPVEKDTSGVSRNRKPTEDEIRFWEPFLEQEIVLLSPKILIGLGAVASSWLLGWSIENTPISKIHGNMEIDAYIRHCRIENGKYVGGANPIRIMPTYHPAATLYRNALRPEVIADFVKVKQFLAECGRYERN